jgi:hypothetical protein
MATSVDADGEIARSQRARAILDDPLVKEALAAIEQGCVEEWRRAQPRDVEARERLWLMLKLAERFRRHFESHVESGRLAGERVASIERERRFRLG